MSRSVLSPTHLLSSRWLGLFTLWVKWLVWVKLILPCSSVRCLKWYFHFPHISYGLVLKHKDSFTFPLTFICLHILTLSFLNTHGSFFVTVVLVHLNSIIEEINYASVCMLYDGSNMKVLILLQPCIWWFCSSAIWSSISGYPDPDVMWQQSAIIFKGPMSKKDRTHEDNDTMWPADVAFWLPGEAVSYSRRMESSNNM
jgi:hypothetical protein